MKNYVEVGEAIQFTAGANITSGSPVLIGDMVGVAVTDVANGAVGVANLEGVYTLAKVPADVIAQGVVLYWNAGASQVTTTVATNKRVGRAYTAAAASTTTVNVRLSQGA